MDLDFKIPKKRVFFDRTPVIAALLKKERHALSRSGAYVAQVARTSIYKKNYPSKPGNPPHSHSGKLRQMIASGVDSNRVCAVAGALRRSDVLNRGATPSVLEHGGRSKVSRPKSPAGRRKDERIYGKFSEYAVIAPRPFMSSALIQSQRAINYFFKH